MKSDYRRLGDYIQQTDIRNENLSVKKLLGVSIDKVFIESHANTVGVDFSNYKIVRRGQFAYGPVTSRNGDKVSIAKLEECDECIISSSYISFEISKPDELNADYLMMLFRNPEFDRYARYNSWGSAREVFSWEELCNTEYNIPSITEQEKIINQQKVIEHRISLLEKINKNLLDLSQNIFVKFMDTYSYTLTPLGHIAEIIDCLHTKKPEAINNTKYQLLQLENITDSGFLDLSSKYYISKPDYENWTRKCEIVEGDCVITNVGRIGAVSQAPNGTYAAMGRNMTCIRLKKNYPFYSYLITALLSEHIRNEISKNTDEGTIMGALNVKSIPLLLFPVFDFSVMNKLESILSPIRKSIEQNCITIQTLRQANKVLLVKHMRGHQGSSRNNINYI